VYSVDAESHYFIVENAVLYFWTRKRPPPKSLATLYLVLLGVDVIIFSKY